jgi:hypothetical protein
MVANMVTSGWTTAGPIMADLMPILGLVVGIVLVMAVISMVKRMVS